MKQTIHILCPEYVPLENKGEEAIIQGVIDCVFPEFDCEYHIVDNNSKVYYKKGNFHVHPGGVFFSDWRTREFGIGPSWEQMYSSACSLIRNGLNKFFPWWILKPHKEARNLKKYLSGKKKPPSKYKESVDQLKKVQYIIAGHNGGLNEYVCHIINELYSINLSYGIFGTSMKPRLKKSVILRVFEKTFANSDFNIARNPIGLKWAEINFPNIHFELKPDPAFAMRAVDKNETEKLTETLGIDLLFLKPVLMVTTAEPAPISRHSFDNYPTSIQKINAHRNFLAGLIKKIHDNLDINILFLPHTIGPNKQMDDRLISMDVIKRADLNNSERVKLLEADLSAKELKGLIGKANFLLAERLHSIIGAIGMKTPFLCIASNRDIRVEGILKDYLGFESQIYYLNNPLIEDAYSKFKTLWDSREKIKTDLGIKDNFINKELLGTGSFIKETVLQKI